MAPKSLENPWEYKMGTDSFGRDVWARLTLGIQNSLIVGGVAGLIALAIGLVVRHVFDYEGELWVNGLNVLFLALLLVYLFLFSITVLIILKTLLPITSLPTLAVIIAITASPIVFAIKSPVGQFFIVAGVSVLLETRLALVGLGAISNTPTLGQILYYSIRINENFVGYWWTIILPALSVLILGGVLILAGWIIHDSR